MDNDIGRTPKSIENHTLVDSNPVIGEEERTKSHLNARIASIMLATSLFLNSCTPINSNTDFTKEDLTKPNVENTEPTPTSIPTNTSTPTELPTVTKTLEPTLTPTPSETPTPRPTVEFHIPPGEVGKNYFYLIDKPYGESGLSGLFFVSGEILNVEVEGQDIVVSIRTLMRGNEVVLRSRTKGFNLINTKLDENEEGFFNFISAENIEDIPIGTEISPRFAYIREKMSPEYRQAMLNTCNSTVNDPDIIYYKNILMPLCTNISTLYADGIGKLTEKAVADWFEDKDLSNVEFDLAVLTEVLYEE